MAKEEMIELEGAVKEVLPSAMFRVDLENGHQLLATTAGGWEQVRVSDREQVRDVGVLPAAKPMGAGRGLRAPVAPGL